MIHPMAPRDLACWPQRLRRAADGIATMLMQAFHLARARALESPSPTVRALAERNGLAWESELQGREIAILRRRRHGGGRILWLAVLYTPFGKRKRETPSRSVIRAPSLIVITLRRRRESRS